VRLYTDDDVHRYQGRWFEARGWVLPFHARYVAWGLWLALEVVAFGVLRLVGVGLFEALLYGSAVAVGVTVALADRLTPETPPRGWLGIGVAELRAWRLAHRRVPRPTTVRMADIHRRVRTR
jgi:hypothetical protein